MSPHPPRGSTLHGPSRPELEAAAYLRLETARLWCRRLAESGPEHARMWTVYRDIGLAGYYASAELAPVRRLECLGEAEAEVALTPVARSPVSSTRMLFCVVTDAAYTLIRAFSEEGPSARGAGAGAISEHLHLAHGHVLSAVEVLQEALR